jgi:hypothetical protein
VTVLSVPALFVVSFGALARVNRICRALSYLYGSGTNFDLLTAGLIASLPLFGSSLTGMRRDRPGYVGYCYATNWISLIAVLPPELNLLRSLEATLCPNGSKLQPMAELVQTEKDRNAVAEGLRRAVRRPSVVYMTFLILLIIQPGDFAEVGDRYITPAIVNLFVTLLAYSIQLMVGIMAFLIVLVMLFRIAISARRG